ncbi:PREDICTED: MLO-like protein 4 [Nelumbo nucifera]|uniref:MLO-like protein n=2 Tax=Nelumbo nucifera TaxID=4432 RepID=A0A822ZAR6_NELNU|nr:PREDICTED: MLO-like protein 4 [Nelumbo nucifera]DAD41630.1 TPA_asm: hypothetical protein HUJ06_015953 [Nelumbo nucifera]
MGGELMKEGRSLPETPTWAVATVVTLIVTVGFMVQRSLKRIGKWLIRTKRKALLAALEKIKEELMLFGLLSLLMGHWTIWVAKICVKHTAASRRFYPCTEESYYGRTTHSKYMLIATVHSSNQSVSQGLTRVHDYCPEGHEPFASFESLEQLHRFLFVLGVTHVSYSFITVALAMLKIYSWRKWENQAKLMAIQGLQGSSEATVKNVGISRLSTFIFHQTSHPWSQHKILVWMLCFSRQFWSSINRADYMALRLGFITNHELHLSYDFHNYMVRSMEDEFCDILGISLPLWIYAILCIFIDFHGTNAYFWLSFAPAILILLIGTKLHRIVVKLAVEIMDTNPVMGNQFNLRDELFWFGKPKLLLWLIQLISFQNAFEMATFIWSLWEIQGPSCFMENLVFLIIRLVSGVIFQFWCSYITFPLYVIIAQMGTRFKKSIVSENIRRSLHGWRRRVKSRLNKFPGGLTTATSTTSLDSLADERADNDDCPPICVAGTSSRFEEILSYPQPVVMVQDHLSEQNPSDGGSPVSHCSGPTYDISDHDHDDDGGCGGGGGDDEIECIMSSAT